MKSYKTVDAYIRGNKLWQTELTQIRCILAGTDLDETVKWGGPCYTHDGKNVVSIRAFKSYFGLWFFQGSQLKDSAAVLVNAQEGVTKAQRQWSMQSKKDIKARAIKAYIHDAILVSKAGGDVKPTRKKVASVVVPAVLKAALAKNKKAAANFDSLSAAKRRDYANYISEAKRETTKAKRLKEIVPMIAAGKPLSDKWSRS